MKFWETIWADRHEVFTVTSQNTTDEIKNKIRTEAIPTNFSVVTNKLLGNIHANRLSLKLCLYNFFLFLPTAQCNLAELDKNNSIDISLKYSDSNKTLIKAWFLISHAAVLFWFLYFFVNLLKGQNSIPFTWNEQEGYFISNYLLLAVSVFIWICFVLLPVLVSKYCWKRTVTLVHVFFEQE